MFVGFFAFIMSLGASSALVGNDCSDMSTIQAIKFESKAFLCSCKIMLDNFNAQTYPVAFLLGLCATTVLLAAFIYNRREDRKDLRCLGSGHLVVCAALPRASIYETDVFQEPTRSRRCPAHDPAKREGGAHPSNSSHLSPERWVASAVLEKLKIHARNEGKVVRRMPALP
jgi:hypothetical protein